MDRLTEQVGRCRTVIDSILSLAEQLKEGTIEKVLAKTSLRAISNSFSAKESHTVEAVRTKQREYSLLKRERRVSRLSSDERER
jgi:hypothetical protein